MLLPGLAICCHMLLEYNDLTSWTVYSGQQGFRIALLVSLSPCVLSLCVPVNWIVVQNCVDRIELCCAELNCVVQLWRQIVSKVLFALRQCRLHKISIGTHFSAIWTGTFSAEYQAVNLIIVELHQPHIAEKAGPLSTRLHACSNTAQCNITVAAQYILLKAIVVCSSTFTLLQR